MTTKEEQFAEFYNKKVIASHAASVVDVTEIKTESGKSTGMFFILESSSDENGHREETSRFVSEKGETYSEEFTSNFYNIVKKDERLLLIAMHKSLVEYVALNVGVPEYIPKEVRAMYPNLKQEIIQKIKEHVDSIKIKYVRAAEQKIAAEKIKRINWAFGETEAH